MGFKTLAERVREFQSIDPNALTGGGGENWGYSDRHAYFGVNVPR